MAEPLLAFDRVCVSYDAGKSFAVSDACLHVPAGTFISLVGASGSGKTSLLKCINRLSEPTSGAVRFEAKPNDMLAPHELRRRIGYVFQGIGLFPHMSVAENIAITPRLLRWPEEKIAARVGELLDLVSLPRDFAQRSSRALSGGQQQRVGIARALAAEPKLIVMDEPFGALDPVTRDGLGTAYRALHERLGLTTIMVTHDIQEAVLLSDRIVVMERGRLVADDTPRTLMRSQEPSVAALMAVPRDQFSRVAKILDESAPRMGDQIAAAWRLLPDYLLPHIALSAAALALGIGIGLPLAVLAARRARWRAPLLGLASLIQTIPGLALLAVFYPVLLALSSFTKPALGFALPALGFLPSVLALSLYAILPVLRNGVTGLIGLDPAILEAAKGVGMTPRQSLLRVEAPLAAPVVMAGIRTSAVWTIGAATLATPVGQTSLGNYIFTGLQIENWIYVAFGCIASAALAIVVDRLLALIETGAARRDTRRIIAGVVILALGAAGAFAAGHRARATYVLGAKNFSEQFILASLMASRIEQAGASASMREGLGSAVAFRALATGDIDAYVDYTGTLWANTLGRSDTLPRDKMLVELATTLREKFGVVLLGTLGFENAYGLAMKRAKATELRIATNLDLTGRAPSLVFGADLEFLHRPEWTKLQEAYALRFRDTRAYDPTFMYRALADATVDVISAFTSDGRIADNDLVVLPDPKGALPSYDAVILVAPKRADDATLIDALKPLIGKIPVEAMRRANLLVDRDADKQTPAAASRALCAEVKLPGC